MNQDLAECPNLKSNSLFILKSMVPYNIKCQELFQIYSKLWHIENLQNLFCPLWIDAHRTSH